MNPDQTAPLEQSDLGPYCLQYDLLKLESKSADDKEGDIIVNDEKKINP